jgi:hypothetical protein
MTTETRSDHGVVLDASLIVRSVRYYAVIGGGLGVPGVVLLLQPGGGDGMGGAIVSGILSMVVLSSAVLSGPIVAAFVGHATAGDGIGGVRARALDSGITNGVGFAVFGVAVAAILFFGSRSCSATGAPAPVRARAAMVVAVAPPWSSGRSSRSSS